MVRFEFPDRHDRHPWKCVPLETKLYKLELVDLMTTAEQKDPDLSRMVEEVRITPVTEFPGRVVLEALTASGELVRLVFLPMMAHKASDDLLRSAAMVKRAEVRPTL